MAAKYTHVVDACALITYLKGEPGHEKFARILQDGRNFVAMHHVNLCEVFYDYLRSDGPTVAEEAWQAATRIVTPIELCTEDFVKRVGRWKVQHHLGLGDSFAAATAEEFACPLLTGDHRDFDPIERIAVLQIVWIP